jgi:hypothetical protein
MLTALGQSKNKSNGHSALRLSSLTECVQGV